ncbi:MAG: FAD:protein FMN transferase [Planctomycetaceae bacterium]|nr:FAD:protein FMN transferase [Planctomycetaceae bacterium]
MMTERPQNTRREFLTGLSARDALASLVDAHSPAVGDETDTARAASAPPGGDEYLLKFSRRAMACQFEFILPAAGPEAGPEAAVAALDLVDDLEAQLTAYRDSSELMEINRRAVHEAVPVEERLFELLQFAVELSARTGGAYDITSGPLSRIWGFQRRQGRVPDAEEIVAALARVGSRHVELNREDRSVRFRASGVELNLGSIGKGYALDRCAELLRAAGVNRALLHGGQSSVVALNPWPEADGAAVEPAQPSLHWTVGVGDPLRPGKRLALARLWNRALGTSGSSVQFFRHAGRRYAHILDPRTGWPAEGLLSATVFAPTAAAADALSTACYVLGLDGALKLCEELGVAAALVESPQGHRRPKIHTFGLGSAEFQLVDDAAGTS